MLVGSTARERNSGTGFKLQKSLLALIYSSPVCAFFLLSQGLFSHFFSPNHLHTRVMNQACQSHARAPLAELHLFTLVSSKYVFSLGPDGDDLNAKSTTVPWFWKPGKDFFLRKLSLNLTRIPRK